MTGFLTQLVARGLGLADVARPRPVSRFEPLGSADASLPSPALPEASAGIETADEAVTPAMTRPTPRRTQRPQPALSPFDDDAADEPLRPAPPTPRAHPATSAPATPAPRVTPPTLPAPRLAVEIRGDESSRANAAPPVPLSVRPTPEPASLPTVPDAPSVVAPPAPMPPTPRPLVERVLVQPEIRPLAERPTPPSGAASLPPPAPSGPTVHVTIGRLEVRALPPPTPGRSPRPAEPSPPVKLDDYLRQRGGRGTP